MHMHTIILTCTNALFGHRYTGTIHTRTHARPLHPRTSTHTHGRSREHVWDSATATTRNRQGEERSRHCPPHTQGREGKERKGKRREADTSRARMLLAGGAHALEVRRHPGECAGDSLGLSQRNWWSGARVPTRTRARSSSQLATHQPGPHAGGGGGGGASGRRLPAAPRAPSAPPAPLPTPSPARRASSRPSSLRPCRTLPPQQPRRKHWRLPPDVDDDDEDNIAEETAQLLAVMQPPSTRSSSLRSRGFPRGFPGLTSAPGLSVGGRVAGDAGPRHEPWSTTPTALELALLGPPPGRWSCPSSSGRVRARVLVRAASWLVTRSMLYAAIAFFPLPPGRGAVVSVRPCASVPFRVPRRFSGLRAPSPAVLTAALRPKRALGSKSELEALYARALAAGLARGARAEETGTVRGRVGLFCLAKDATSDV